MFKMFPMLQLPSKFDQGLQSWHENGKFTGDYSMTQFERSRLKIVQEGSKKKTQYTTSMITDQIRQQRWAFVRILNLVAR